MFDAKENIAYTLSIIRKGSNQIVIHIIRVRATVQQLTDMLQMPGTYIKIRPRQNNPALEVLDPDLRQQIARITQELLGGV